MQDRGVVDRHVVLVVEDDVSLREALVDALHDEGYFVVTAENGKEALQFLAGSDVMPCLVLLDLMMPVMNGWTFLSTVRSDPRFATLRICIVSAVPQGQMPDGVLCAFQKPVDLGKLLQVVETHCHPG